MWRCGWPGGTASAHTTVQLSALHPRATSPSSAVWIPLFKDTEAAAISSLIHESVLAHCSNPFIMDGFSTTSLVALTSSIIARATSCIAEAKVLSGNLQSADKHKYGLQLEAITDHLQTFMTKVVDLQQGLHSATVISDRLQSSLRNALGDSERTTAILGKDLMRFQPMSSSPEIDWTSIIQGHIDVFRRHGEVFSLLTHVLGL